MEQDINELKRLFYSNRLTQYGKRKLIEYYEKRIKELEEEMAQYKTIKDIAEKIKSTVTEEDLEQALKDVDDNFIPVSLVQQKIEEYTKLLKNCNRFSDVDRIKTINERILAYKELLEKRK